MGAGTNATAANALSSLNKQQVGRLAAAIATIVTFDVAMGLTYPLLSFLLKAQQYGELLIGLNAAMTPIGLILVSYFIPKLVSFMGSKNLVRIAAVLLCATLLAFKVFPSIEAWFFLRFLLGVTGGVLFGLSEAWVVQAAEGPARARIMALYAAILSAGFAIGPFMLPFTGYEGWAPFIIAATFAILTLIPIIYVTTEDKTSDETQTMSMLDFIPLAPMLVTAVFVFSFMDSGVLALFPIFGTESGLSKDVTSFALGVLIIGNAVLQFFVGWLADRFPKYFVIAACCFTTVIMCAILPMVMGSLLMWPVLVILGTAGFSIYTVSLAIFGERFKGSALIAGASAFAAMWGAGGIISPPSVGYAMELYGPNALPAVMAVAYVLLAVFILFRISQGRR
ncbi:MAG: MFS transporter [Pseudomonadota bacterium]